MPTTQHPVVKNRMHSKIKLKALKIPTTLKQHKLVTKPKIIKKPKPTKKPKSRYWTVESYIREYRKEVRENAEKLKRHINSGHCHKEDDEKTLLLRDFKKTDARFLSVNNPEARILFYKYWAYHGHRFADGQDTFLVTLTPMKFVKNLAAAKEFDIRRLQAWARNELRGFDYIGAVEIAYYTNFAVGLLQPPAIAFHVHVVVRNPNRFALQAVMDRINAKHDSLVPGCPAADMRPIRPGDHHTVLKYLVKEPCGIYRAYPMRREVIDRETGEVFKQHTGRYWQNSKPATPGVQLRAREVIGGWRMDKIVIAGGSGRDTLETIRREALKSLPRKLRSGRQDKWSGYFEPKDWD